MLKRYRSAITGKFVSVAYAVAHPRTTVGERKRRDAARDDVKARQQERTVNDAKSLR